MLQVPMKKLLEINVDLQMKFSPHLMEIIIRASILIKLQIIPKVQSCWTSWKSGRVIFYLVELEE